MVFVEDARFGEGIDGLVLVEIGQSPAWVLARIGDYPLPHTLSNLERLFVLHHDGVNPLPTCGQLSTVATSVLHTMLLPMSWTRMRVA